MKLFGCTKYKIDQARKLKFEKREIIIPQKLLFSSGLLQDEVHKITFDSRNKETVPKAILTTCYSHAIGFYIQNCEKTGNE